MTALESFAASALLAHAANVSALAVRNKFHFCIVNPFQVSAGCEEMNANDSTSTCSEKYNKRTCVDLMLCSQATSDRIF